MTQTRRIFTDFFTWLFILAVTFQTMTAQNNLPHDRLREVLKKYNRLIESK
jgi:hypothetical protein